MRGGTANCHVTISTSEIGSPLVSVTSVLIAMNNPSLDKFETEVDPAGLINYDSSLIDHAPTRSDVEALAVPATEMADKIGSAKSANMVALGALLGKTNLLDKAAVVEAMRAMTKKAELLDINVKAIDAQFAQAQAVEESLWGVNLRLIFDNLREYGKGLSEPGQPFDANSTTPRGTNWQN